MTWTGKLISTVAVPDADKVFLQEISQTDPIYDKMDILMRKGPLIRSSCRWILDHEDFKRWYCTEKAGVFWIKGDPGKGKTMLLCGIIEQIEEFEKFLGLEKFVRLEGFERLTKLEAFERFLKFDKIFKVEKLKSFNCFVWSEKEMILAEFKKFKESGEPDELEKFEKIKDIKDLKELDKYFSRAKVAYFFCSAADYRTNNAAAVIRGLIKPRPALLKRIWEKYGGGPKGQLDGIKALAILCDIFGTIVQDGEFIHFTCVVDALDECIEDCDHLLNLIVKTSDTVNWLISSRNEKHMERKLVKISRALDLELQQNVEHVSASVDVYINYHIKDITAVQDDDALQSWTSSLLKDKASGTFLWVALVMEQLRDADHWQVEDVLKEMPEGLESIYGLILNRIDKLKAKVREACQALLSVVSTAMRPLHLTELLEFMKSSWTISKRFDKLDHIRAIRDLTKDCESILSIRDDVVYFVHQSAKDYIMEVEAHRLFPVRLQHYKMFDASLDVMSSLLKYNMCDLKDPTIHVDEIPPGTVNSDLFASLGYCCAFWVEHLAKGLEHLEDISSKKLHSFLMEKFLCWIESLALMGNYILYALPAVQKLKKTIDRHCESRAELSLHPTIPQIGYLRQFLDDACRFLTHSTTWVPHWPLQLYFSAIELEPGDSAIKKTFDRAVRDKFGPLPAAFLLSHNRQPSLQRRALTFSSRGEISFVIIT